MFVWLTNNGWHMARQEAAKVATPLPPPLCFYRSSISVRHNVASTHILPLWARNVKNSDCCPARCSHPTSPLVPHLTPATSPLQLPKGFLQPNWLCVWVTACISLCTVCSLMLSSLHTVTSLLQSGALTPVLRKRTVSGGTSFNRFGLSNILMFAEVFQGGLSGD